MPSDEIVPTPEISRPAWTAAPEPEALAAVPAIDRAGRLTGRIALIAAGDGAIGREVAIAFAHEGADVALLYRDDHEAAQAIMHSIVAAGRETMALSGDVGLSAFCDDAVSEVAKRFGRIDILVNAAADPHEVADFEALTDARIESRFRTNVFAQFFLTRAALPHMAPGASIVNSAAAATDIYPMMVDVAASGAAAIGFTRALSLALAGRGVRVNAVVAGPLCAPGSLAASFAFLASDDAGCMNGEVLHATASGILPR
jgi:NAD(P)-dependent dehydrogenase (short-subunit alcohol dehydrogenase family)